MGAKRLEDVGAGDQGEFVVCEGGKGVCVVSELFCGGHEPELGSKESLQYALFPLCKGA